MTSKLLTFDAARLTALGVTALYATNAVMGNDQPHVDLTFNTDALPRPVLSTSTQSAPGALLVITPIL